MLAAILAAIMSTVSSQLLVTSSSLTEDVYKTFVNKQASEKQLVFISRVCVVLVALLAIGLAHNRDSSILNIVANAWAGFGAAFGPLIVLGLYWKHLTLANAGETIKCRQISDLEDFYDISLQLAQQTVVRFPFISCKLCPPGY